MTYSSTTAQPSYSARVIQPLFSVLRTHAYGPSAPVHFNLPSMDPDRRVDAGYVHQLFRFAEETIDPATGLRAGATCAGGDFDLFHFLVLTAPTRREAVATASRYVRLLSDEWTISSRESEQRLIVEVACTARQMHASEEFVLAALLHHPVFALPALHSSLHVYFKRHSMDASFNPILDSLTVHRGAAFTGFSVLANVLDEPLATQSPRLHALLRSWADRTLASMPSTQSMAQRAEKLVLDGLASRAFGLRRVAKLLELHPRKLSRLLVREGTSFEVIVDGARRSRALELLARSEYSINEIARLTGFAGKAPFHRAFRRWMEQTPRMYRLALQGSMTSVARSC